MKDSDWNLLYRLYHNPNLTKAAESLYQIPMFTVDGKPFIRDTWMLYKRHCPDIPLVKNFINFVKEQQELSLEEQQDGFQAGSVYTKSS